MTAPLSGLIAAVFTPLKANREIDLGQIKKFTDYLADSPVTGIYTSRHHDFPVKKMARRGA